MTKVAVAALSTSSLDAYSHPHDVRILRLNITLDGQTYVDGKDLSNDEFQRWQLENPDKLATTNPPNRQDIIRFFLNLVDEGFEEVIVITISTQLSQTYAKIEEIVPVFEGKLKFHLVDSQTATFAEGFMALQAEKSLARGLSVAQTLNQIELLKQHNTIMFGVENLTYLIKNGRLSAPAGMVANLLNVKPLIQVSPDGRAEVAERIISIKRAMNAMSDHLKTHTANNKYMLYTLYSGNRQLHQEFTQLLAERNGLTDLPAYPINPAIAAHVGPHAVGFGVFWRN